MNDILGRYPNTPEGIKIAQGIVGPHGVWEELIDWWGNGSDVVSRRTRILEAVRQGADVSPDLIDETRVIPSIKTETVADIGAITFRGIANEAGQFDVPSRVQIPTGTRADLPA